MSICLKDIADEIRDTYIPNPENDLPYIGLEHVEQGSLHISGMGSSRDVESHKFKFRKGDILFGTLRPYFRKVIVAPCDGVCSTEFCVVRPKEDNDRNFLFYGMSHPQFIKYATTNSKGARPRTKWKLFSDYQFPEFSQQRRRDMGNILSTYDDLIENNRRRIQLLEQAARLLYKEWFVHLRFPGHEHVKIKDGVPEGWERKTAFGVMEVLSGGTPKTKMPEYWDADIPFFTPKDAVDYAYVFETEKTITDEGLRNCNSKLYPKDTIFITARGTVGKINLAQTAMAMNQSCYALVAKPPLNQYFLYLALIEAVEQFRSRAVGAVFDAIIRDTFKLIPFIVPDEKLIKLFTDYVSPILNQIDVVSTQIRKLTKARDLLLPRLMNGEIAV